MAPLPAVANQLNLNLTFHHPEYESRYNLIPITKALINSKNKPDFIISVFRGSSARPLLELIEKHKIPLITVSTGVPKFEQKQIGLPQQNFKYWLAQIISDDISSGGLVAKELVLRKLKADINKKIKLLAIGGNKIFEASRLRDKGLLQEVSNNDNIEFLQLVHSDWDNNTTKRMTKQLINRHKNIDAIWTANVDIAFSAEQTLSNMPSLKNAPPIIGTVDWTQKGFSAIKENKILFSLGSNHFIGIWSLILYHDIAHGMAITPSDQTTFITSYILADKNNIEKIEPYLDADNWKHINIKGYSKIFNKQLNNYNFDFSLLLNKK